MSLAKASDDGGSYREDAFTSRSSRGSAATTSFDQRGSNGFLAAVPEDGSILAQNGVDGLARARAALGHKASGRRRHIAPSHGFWGGCGRFAGRPNRVRPSVLTTFSERMVSLLVRSSSDLFYVTDADDGDLLILYASVTVSRFLGYASEELAGCALRPQL